MANIELFNIGKQCIDAISDNNKRKYEACIKVAEIAFPAMCSVADTILEYKERMQKNELDYKLTNNREQREHEKELFKMKNQHKKNKKKAKSPNKTKLLNVNSLISSDMNRLNSSNFNLL